MGGGSPWTRVPTAVLVAGVVPAVLLNYFVLEGLSRSGTQVLDFLLHLLPLAMGAWAASSFPARRPRLMVAAGVLAGVIELVVMVGIFSDAGQRFLISHFDAFTVPAFEDYVAVPATITLFIFGALAAERRKRGERPREETRDRLIATPDNARTMRVLGVLGLVLQAYSTLGGAGVA